MEYEKLRQSSDYCNKAMRYYPESKEFRLKKADLFHSKKDLDSFSGCFGRLEN